MQNIHLLGLRHACRTKRRSDGPATVGQGSNLKPQVAGHVDLHHLACQLVGHIPGSSEGIGYVPFVQILNVKVRAAVCNQPDLYVSLQAAGQPCVTLLLPATARVLWALATLRHAGLDIRQALLASQASTGQRSVQQACIGCLNAVGLSQPPALVHCTQPACCMMRLDGWTKYCCQTDEEHLSHESSIYQPDLSG